MNEYPLLINDSNPITIPIHANSEFAPVLNYGQGQVEHILLPRWIWGVVWEFIVPSTVNGNYIHADPFQYHNRQRSRNSITTVYRNSYLSTWYANVFNHCFDVIILKTMHIKQAPLAFFETLPLHGFSKLLKLFTSHWEGSLTNLETIVFRRVMAGSDHYRNIDVQIL